MAVRAALGANAGGSYAADHGSVVLAVAGLIGNCGLATIRLIGLRLNLARLCVRSISASWPWPWPSLLAESVGLRQR